MASGASGSASGSTSNSSSSASIAKDDSKWYFTAEQLASSPSRKCGMDADQELMYRQRAANLIQDMGQRLQVSQLCINTAIVYMHRFYAFHSFTQFHRNSIAAAALFLAAKVEEQPRKLEHIIKVVHICLGLEAPDPLKENYAEQAQDLVLNENVLLQTLGFDVAIDHPHTHVVKTCHLVKASKDLAQTSYFMASNSLHLTTMCLQYKPTVVACFCIHLACKWSRWEIPQSNEGRHWFHYVDKSVTLDLLKQLTDEFLHIFDRCPTRLKSKMKSIRADQAQMDDPSRRSASSSGVPGSSSSIPRGIDDAGSSSSSHHRSSSHSQHSHSKQSSSSADPMKASQTASSNHKIPSSSSSSSASSRSRSDRPGTSSSSQPMHPQHGVSGSGHYGTSGSSGKMPQMPHHGGSSRSSMPPSSTSSSSSSSTRPGYVHEGSRDSKNNRIMPSAASSGSSSSSMQMHPYGQSKMDRHSSNISNSNSSNNQKGQTIPHMDSKKPIKTQSSMMASLFSNSQDGSTRTSSSSMMKQPSTSYGSHPPSYSQSMSNRNNSMPSSESVSVPSQQQQSFKNQLQPQLSTGSESSFRLIDDSNRLSDPMQMCTPPKQSKPSSIFSPDWKDSQSESSSINTGASATTGSGGKSRSQGHTAGGAMKPIKESPSSREKKPLIPSYNEQSQQKQRSDTPKKERRSETVSTPSGNHQQKSNEKKSSSLTSSNSSMKRQLESTSSSSLTATTIDPVDLLGISKLSSNQAPTKRSHPSSEQIRQDDGTDFRESKLRKVEVASPSDQLFNSSFDLANTFDSKDDGFSMFSFNDPGPLLSQPLLNDSKPINVSTKTTFSNMVNGIETNPALVSSLLKESLCSNESKFVTLNSNNSTIQSAVTNTTNAPSTANLSAGSFASSLSSITASSTAPSVSNLSTSSTTSTLSTVPELIKTEASSQDINASSTISSLLAHPQSANITATSATSAVPSMVTSNPTTLTTTVSGAGALQTLTGSTLAVAPKDDEHHRSKSEKKKKKDKHKHKEKDKSKDKDREERKKHKKDKDRHRDRDKSELSSDATLVSPPPGPIKIKLPKDKLNLPSLSDTSTSGNAPSADSGLKIKIPKDRLSGSSSLTSNAPVGGSVSVMGTGGAVPATNPLKLKISKDKIEHYNINTGGDNSSVNNGSGNSHGVGNMGSGSGHHSHSSKKKDRDKDREKSKSSKSSSANDYNKQNGGGSGSSAGGQTGNSSSKSSSSKHHSSSQQPQHYSLYTTANPAISHHPASFDYMQHAQAPTLQQQQQYFNQFGAFTAQQQQQQQQQTIVQHSNAMKIAPGGNTAALPANYYSASNPNCGNNNAARK